MIDPWGKIGALAIGIGVAFGALGAHFLAERLTGRAGEVYDTAVLYHLLHGCGLLFVSFAARLGILTPSSALAIGALFFSGILLFSGSLYGLALTQLKILGMITPIGGVLFLSGWALFAIKARRE